MNKNIAIPSGGKRAYLIWAVDKRTIRCWQSVEFLFWVHLHWVKIWAFQNLMGRN